ncbi:MAG: hypothetical protein KA746_16990 [Pyrinomonadaceae bacterium]|nr:hypothetical protein [Pyrinomonadaceae bacterium]MBP6212764.1 hypothetical protein [Pyrinomonadaceae bacterium]
MATNASAQGTGCSGGKRAGIYYTDCFPKNPAAPDDTDRLQFAIDTIVATVGPGGAVNTGSGKLIFNEGTYEISNALKLNSNLILEGTSSSIGATTTSSRINLTVTANTVFKSVFLINGGVAEVAIRDLGLSTPRGPNQTDRPTAGTVGIEGYNTNLVTSSANFQFSNLNISGFEKGIYIHTWQNLDKFQFDNVRLDRASFIHCGTAIELDSSDTGWTMNNINIVSRKNDNGINIIKGGYISMNLIVGNGYTPTVCNPCTPTNQPIPESGTFVRIRKQGVTSIHNSISENFVKSLDIDTPARDHPILLSNSDWGDAVTINNAIVVSMANMYGNNWKVSNPVIKGKSNVFSVGDRFCWDLSEPSEFCANSKFLVQDTATLLQQNVSSENAEADLLKPALKIQQPAINKILLELGNYTPDGESVYRLKRDGIGRLSFTSDKPAISPWKGYNFDGPVRLQSYELAIMGGLGTVSNGDMVYCSNCAPSTTPCQTGGGGALAIFVNGQWSCK